MHLWSSWDVCGVVVEKRISKSPKNAAWRGYKIKVSELGATYDLEVTEEQFEKINQNENLHFRGAFEKRGVHMNLVVAHFGPAKERGKAA